MGWTYERREKGEASHFEWFRRKFDWGNSRLLDMAAGSLTTLYGAYEIANPGTVREVHGLVVLIRWVPNDWYNFGYKDMDENMGPFEYGCPKRIFEQLTPTTNEYALEWRDGVRQCHEARDKASAVRPGDMVKFETPLSFTDGVTSDTFQFVKRSTFLRGWSRVHITNWRTRAFEVIA